MSREGSGRLVRRLIERLRLEGLEVPDGWTFKRTRAGHWQRSAGYWRWSLSWDEDPHRFCEIGSQYRVASIVAAPVLEFDEWPGVIHVDVGDLPSQCPVAGGGES